jgi:hypothetical protein
VHFRIDLTINLIMHVRSFVNLNDGSNRRKRGRKTLAMSKTEPNSGEPPRLSQPKFPLPPQAASLLRSAPPPPETLIYGARESGCTTVTFIIQPGRGVDDLLMIGLDEHNGEGKSRLMVRGGAEAKEIPSQLRWLANKIEKEIGKHDPPLVSEHVVLNTGGR